MNHTVRFQKILRRLAIIDEGLLKTRPGSGWACPPPGCWIPRPRRWRGWGRWWRSGHRRSAWNGAPPRALAPGATDDGITSVLLAIAPVAGLGRITGSVPGVAAARGYDVEAALAWP
jgi:hypothetical protein